MLVTRGAMWSYNLEGSGEIVGWQPTIGGKQWNQSYQTYMLEHSEHFTNHAQKGQKKENQKHDTLPKSPAKDRMSFSISM